MKHGFFRTFILVLALVGWCLPAFAASTPSATTPVVVIMDGYAQRITTNALVNAGLGSALTTPTLTSYDVGLTPGLGLTQTAVEYGDGVFHKTVLSMVGTTFTFVDDGSTGHISTKIYTFPEGYMQVLGASTNLTCTSAGTFGDTGTAVFSLGTAVTTDSTLSGAEATIVASTSSGAFVDGAGSLLGAPVSAPLEIDGHTTAGSIYLNLGDAADPGSDSVLTCTGTITFNWVNNGDN